MSERFMKNFNGETVFSLEYDKETLRDMVIEKQEEIERLNNIIKEFEILIENEINESKLEDDYDRANSLEYCLSKLQELKGSDKE